MTTNEGAKTTSGLLLRLTEKERVNTHQVGGGFSLQVALVLGDVAFVRATSSQPVESSTWFSSTALPRVEGDGVRYLAEVVVRVEECVEHCDVGSA